MAFGFQSRQTHRMASPPPSPSRQAELLAERGNIGEAVALLERTATSGDGDAALLLARWRLSGALITRDLKASRHWFGLAAEAGKAEAAFAYLAFLGNGTGGERDWPASVRRLEELARTSEAARRQLETVSAMSLTAQGDPATVPDGEVLATAPYVARFADFLTSDECDYLTEAAAPLLQASVVVDPRSGQLMRNPVRTSDAAGFPLMLENPAIHAINRRLAAISATSPEQGEPLQVLRYAPGQEYKPHSDALPHGDNQRILTILVYLNDDYEGGETRFLATGLEIRGCKGDALLFRNADARGRPDPDAQHAGLPVTRGVKFVASRWIRERRLDLAGPRRAV
jgi:prolyl 4-hydroxylase